MRGTEKRTLVYYDIDRFLDIVFNRHSARLTFDYEALRITN